MKLDVAVNEVVLSNVGTTGEFKIRNSAKAFKILSDGLYSNKIRAIVRELSCNAVDSHVAAGHADKPFDVHLPTLLEPWFAVRDYGVGLDGDQVVNIYTTYFESTKSDSNDFIGALGLGSKSPFSYTENFTVTAIRNGIRRIYSAFINEQGVPSIAEMGQELTDEGNGVEVKFSVTDRQDFGTFRYEAHHVFAWFRVQPRITGIHDWLPKTIDYIEKDIAPGVHYSNAFRHSTAVMGNIAYPVKISDPAKHFGELADLLNSGLVMEFDIGELDFAASREELSYVPLTIHSIRTKLEALNNNLADHVATQANAITCVWARSEFLSTKLRESLFSAAVRKYIIDTKFELVSPSKYGARFEFKLNTEYLKDQNLSIQAFSGSRSASTTLKHKSEYVGNDLVYNWAIPVDIRDVFVLNDLKTGCVSRARYQFTQQLEQKIVYCISHSSSDLQERQAAYDALMQKLHNPPTVIKASELKIKPKEQPLSTCGIMTVRKKSSSRRGMEYVWTPYTQELDDSVTYYYVAMSNYVAKDTHGKDIDIVALQQLIDECGVADIAKLKIFGVRKNRIKEIQELHNWVQFESKIRQEVAKINDSHIAAAVASETLDNYYYKQYTNVKLAKLVSKDSPYAKYIESYVSTKRAAGNVTQLVALCNMYGKSVQIDTVKKKFEQARDELYKRYPLLQYCSAADDKELADYINMVDNKETT